MTTEKQYFKVRNFEKFQHYKDRNPSWIKLYSNLLNDMNFASMTDSQQINLVKIWLLASQNKNRLIFDSHTIGKQLGANSRISLQYFVDNEWLEIIGVTPKNASKMVAPNKDKQYKQDTKEKHLKKPAVKKAKSPPKKPEPTNPDIKIAIDHFHDEYLLVYKVKPEILGAHAKIFQNQLKKRSIDDLKILIWLYLRDDDPFLTGRCHPIALFTTRIDVLMVQLAQKKKGAEKLKKTIEKAEAQKAARITLPPLNGPHCFWSECLYELEVSILPESYDTFIRPIKYLGMSNDQLYIEVPSQFFRDAVLKNFHQEIIDSNPKIQTIKILIPEE